MRLPGAGSSPGRSSELSSAGRLFLAELAIVAWRGVPAAVRRASGAGVGGGGEGGAIDLPPGHPAGQSQPPAILELRGRREWPPVEARPLEPHPSETGLHLHRLALRLEARRHVITAAERSRIHEDDGRLGVELREA